MARIYTETLVDDLDGTESDSVTTVEFGLDGRTYRIDLTKEHAAELRSALEPYVAKAVFVAGRSRRGTSPQRRTGEGARVRAWARANGHPIGSRGRLSRELIQAFRESES